MKEKAAIGFEVIGENGEYILQIKSPNLAINLTVQQAQAVLDGLSMCVPKMKEFSLRDKLNTPKEEKLVEV